MVWEFKAAAGGSWYWRFVPDEGNSAAPAQSARTFMTLLECVADAELNGYSRAEVLTSEDRGSEQNSVGVIPQLSRKD
jgi:hypothetical protein